MSNTANQTRTSQSSDADVIDLVKLFGTLIDARWSIILVTMLFAVCGVAYALLATPIYKADALIQVESSSSDMSALVGDMGDMFASESSSVTEIEIIKSRMILGQTVDKFNLTTIAEPDYFPVIGKGLARFAGEQQRIDVARFTIADYAELPAKFELVVGDANHYTVIDDDGKQILKGSVGELASTGNGNYELFVRELQAEAGDSFSLEVTSKVDAIDWLQENLSISERGKDSGILQLSFTGESKQQIEAILNSISNNYFLQNIERSSAEAQKSLEFLKGHLPGIKQELTIAEDTLNRYRQDNDSIDLGLEAQSTLKVMVELEAQLNELTFKESDVSKLYTKDHPAYISLLDKRKVLLAEKQRLNSQIQALPETQREVLRMTRDVEVNQEIYIQLLGKVQELSVLKAGTVGNVRILDEAQSYTKAVKPKKPLIAIIATLLGAVLAIAVALIKVALHKGVETPEEVEELGLPVYASIPVSAWQNKIDQKLTKAKSRLRLTVQERLLAEANPADLSVEALRALRTSMHFAMMEAKNNVVMITGPAPNIGKSFVSANLAAVIAKSGQKVLLIDGDMRKGYLQRHFDLDW